MTAPRPRPEILQIAPYVGGKSEIPGSNHPIKLSSNEGAFGPPPAAIAAYHAVGATLHRYPDGGAQLLRRALGRSFGLDPERIVCGAGSDDLIYHLCLAYCSPGDEIIMSDHGFLIYDIVGRYAGARVRRAPERHLTADIDAILAQVSAKTRIVFLANPNNPTGTMLSAAEVARLHAGLPGDVLLVLDAAYAEYVEAADYDPGIALVDAASNVVMTRTFSKIFGLGGARIGWCYAPAEIIDVLNRVRGPFNVSVPAQAAGVAALDEPDWIARGREHNSYWRDWLTARLREAGLTVHPSVANFILLDLGSEAAMAATDAQLRQNGIIVRRVESYGLPQMLRITIGTAEECTAVADTLAAFAAATHG